MTGLDQHNMMAIENTLKKAFRNLDESQGVKSKNNNKDNEERVTPAQFTKICVSLMWLMKVYMVFKDEDDKVNKISMKILQKSMLYHMIEGVDIVEKMVHFD